VAKAGTWALIPRASQDVAFIFISPLLGILIGSRCSLPISWIFVRSTPSRVDAVPQVQLFSSSLYSLGHGGNDAQKTIGIIWMLLIAAGITGERIRADWVVIACYVTIGWDACSAAGAS
jgi:PiT family inorganic phosphate transporter